MRVYWNYRVASSPIFSTHACVERIREPGDETNYRVRRDISYRSLAWPVCQITGILRYDTVDCTERPWIAWYVRVWYFIRRDKQVWVRFSACLVFVWHSNTSWRSRAWRRGHNYAHTGTDHSIHGRSKWPSAVSVNRQHSMVYSSLGSSYSGC